MDNTPKLTWDTLPLVVQEVVFDVISRTEYSDIAVQRLKWYGDWLGVNDTSPPCPSLTSYILFPVHLIISHCKKNDTFVIKENNTLFQALPSFSQQNSAGYSYFYHPARFDASKATANVPSLCDLAALHVLKNNSRFRQSAISSFFEVRGLKNDLYLGECTFAGYFNAKVGFYYSAIDDLFRFAQMLYKDIGPNDYEARFVMTSWNDPEPHFEDVYIKGWDPVDPVAAFDPPDVQDLFRRCRKVHISKMTYNHSTYTQTCSSRCSNMAPYLQYPTTAEIEEADALLARTVVQGSKRCKLS